MNEIQGLKIEPCMLKRFTSLYHIFTKNAEEMQLNGVDVTKKMFSNEKLYLAKIVGE